MTRIEITDDDWLPSDVAFEVFLATVGPRDLSAFEFQLYQWHRLRGAAA